MNSEHELRRSRKKNSRKLDCKVWQKTHQCLMSDVKILTRHEKKAQPQQMLNKFCWSKIDAWSRHCFRMWSTALKCVISTCALLYYWYLHDPTSARVFEQRIFHPLCCRIICGDVLGISRYVFFPWICLQFDHINRISLYQKDNEICFNMCNTKQPSDEIRSGR